VAKKVNGWLARDGRVYSDENEANLIDTTAGLMEACERENIAPKKFLQAVNTLHAEIQDYLALRYDRIPFDTKHSSTGEAYNSERETTEPSEDATDPSAQPPHVDPAINGGGEEDPPRLQHKPTGRLEPMPDVRDGAQSPDVPTEQSRPPLRSGFHYARSVQRHTFMATPSLDGLT